MEPDDLLCSRNARPQKALVVRAQWKINQPPSLRDNERGMCSFDARSEGRSATPPQEEIGVGAHIGRSDRAIALIELRRAAVKIDLGRTLFRY